MVADNSLFDWIESLGQRRFGRTTKQQTQPFFSVQFARLVFGIELIEHDTDVERKTKLNSTEHTVENRTFDSNELRRTNVSMSRQAAVRMRDPLLPPSPLALLLRL